MQEKGQSTDQLKIHFRMKITSPTFIRRKETTTSKRLTTITKKNTEKQVKELQLLI